MWPQRGLQVPHAWLDLIPFPVLFQRYFLQILIARCLYDGVSLFGDYWTERLTSKLINLDNFDTRIYRVFGFDPASPWQVVPSFRFRSFFRMDFHDLVYRTG